VEEEISKGLLKETAGINTKFSGAGREDRTARCLDWREFIIEVLEPRKRKIDLKKLQKRINKSKKIRVNFLRFTNKKEIKKLKEKKQNKTYRLMVDLKDKIKRNDLKKINKINGIITQQTPLRMRRSRSNRTRKRKVISVKSKYINSKKIELVIRGEAGLYIKELVTGDEGNTKPSVSELLNARARVKSLDVIKIG
jgi:tRNA pseudouridine synthase 10